MTDPQTHLRRFPSANGANSATVRLGLLTALGLAVLSISGGCAGTVSGSAGVMYGDPVVYVDAPPAYVYSQPVVYYRGYPAYWVDNRWYYQSSSGWVVFRREPSVLYQHRVRVRAAPVRAPAARVRVGSAPRVVQRPPPRVRSAPPPRVRPDVRVRGEVRGSVNAPPPRDRRDVHVRDGVRSDAAARTQVRSTPARIRSRRSDR